MICKNCNTDNAVKASVAKDLYVCTSCGTSFKISGGEQEFTDEALDRLAEKIAERIERKRKKTAAKEGSQPEGNEEDEKEKGPPRKKDKWEK